MQQVAAQSLGVGNTRLESTINKLEIAENIVKNIAQQNQFIYQVDGVTPLKDTKGQNVKLFQSTASQFSNSYYVPLSLPKNFAISPLADPNLTQYTNAND